MERQRLENRNVNSCPTQTNEDRYWEVVKTVDPELYLIKIALIETGMNPEFVPRIIRAISNISYGTGYGDVRIFIREKIVKQIRSEELDKIEEPVSIDK